MLRALHAQPDLSERFMASLLKRNIDLEEDLCDQLFNDSEKRLARVLVKLSRFGQHADMPDAKMPRLTHETLAEMMGTTRPRITFFMNKFKKLRLIEYTGTGDVTVRDDLMTDENHLAVGVQNHSSSATESLRRSYRPVGRADS